MFTPKNQVQVVKPSKLENTCIPSHCTEEQSPLCLENPPSIVENILVSISNEDKKFMDECVKLGLQIGKCEKALEDLNDDETDLKQEIAGLQDSLPNSSTMNICDISGKDIMLELIARWNDSAPSLFCDFFRCGASKLPRFPFLRDIIGLVGLLGTVSTTQISSILSEYLGEDQMLALVCKSRAAADALQKYEEEGSTDNDHSLSALATSLGRSIKGRFVVICLEDIRPYAGSLSDANNQRILSLPSPTLANGGFPQGFLGYAVNLIDIESNHLPIMTATGYGLRETLFYRLFGDLQVYETMEHLKQATACSINGAVSLDGGIARGNGVISLGHCEPEITFPVVAIESMPLSQDDTDLLKLIEEKKQMLIEKSLAKSLITKAHETYKKKFNHKRSKYEKFLAEKGHLMNINWAFINVDDF